MDKEFLDIFGTSILGFFFGIYDEEALEKQKQYLGKYIIEHGGVEQVVEQNFQTTSIPKEQIIERLNECVNFAKEKAEEELENVE